MPSAADVDGDVLRTTVRDAICAAYRYEGQLVRERAHERSILFHIGRHLAAALSGWPDPWDVHLEYNRAGDADKPRRITKFLLATDGRLKRPVLPDRIIHRRGHTAVEANLLVMEAKKRECADRTVDYDKLRGFRNEFGYRVAVTWSCSPTRTHWNGCGWTVERRASVTFRPRALGSRRWRV